MARTIVTRLDVLLTDGTQCVRVVENAAGHVIGWAHGAGAADSLAALLAVEIGVAYARGWLLFTIFR